LVLPEWWGVNDYAKYRATELAKLGYVAFVVDMYGDDKVTTDPTQAQEYSKPFYDDRSLMRRRVLLGLQQLQEQTTVNKNKIALVGYCFGGTAALETARVGTKLAGVAAFHSGLATPEPADIPGKIKAKLLVMVGADDPMVKPEERTAFVEEMREAKADFQFIEYSGAQHAFTNPNADKFNVPGVAYNKKADERSWALMQQFFGEIFKDPAS
jgi:dienelactone hydrolase